MPPIAGISDISGGPVSEDNAFVWNVTLFGPEGTLYEDGLFSVEIVFPEAQEELPRVRFLTPMFHPNISPSGYPWFALPVDKANNVEYLLTSLRNMLTSEPNPSPATWLNEEAAKLFFAKSLEDRQQYAVKVSELLCKMNGISSEEDVASLPPQRYHFRYPRIYG